MSWETHDEVLALPFLVWSMCAHLSGKHFLKLLILIPALLFKETLGLNIFGLSLYYAISNKSLRFSSFLLSLFGLVVFVLYTKVLPNWLWVSTLDGLSRISSISELLNKSIIFEKLIWLIKSLSPVVPFLFLHSRRTLVQSFLLLLVVGYNYGAIVLTNFPNMYKPFNYYSITPVLFAFLAFTIPIIKSEKLIKSAFFSLILISLIGPRINTRLIFKRGFSIPSAYSEVKETITPEKVVIADDYTASIFASNKQTIRLYHANKMLAHFDHIVLSKATEHRLSLYLRSWSVHCGETERYTIRCALQKVRP
ncbi:MAG: DUF2079 domain-containing protein [SAR324 cluster bacterium]|uniref:DUF2079 domain-containing protein n=1 Tax=SAR324 cluster bacterium TaxID=2024889 RepID=A0A7X9FSS7_9DELT|nr:DUF2079 domain-containing protein [SAR324 cluster bacterium]